MNKLTSVLLWLILAGLTACTEPENDTFHFDSTILERAQDTVCIGDQNMVVDTWAWRNLMPPVTNESYLYALVHFRSDDSLQADFEYSLNFMYIIKDSSYIWQTFPDAYNLTDSLDAFLCYGGPLWAPGDTVESYFTFWVDDSLYVLRNKDILIEAVY